MHLNIFGHIPQDERLEKLDALVQKLLLKFHDTLRNAIDGPLALVDAPDQPKGGTEFLLNIPFIFLYHRAIVRQDTSVKIIDS
jgi:hypothetical protein